MTTRERGVVSGLIAVATDDEKRKFSRSLELGASLTEATDELQETIQIRTGGTSRRVVRRVT